MGSINNRTELINYIKTMLGEPVIRVEVANIQFNNIFDKCTKDFCRYNYGEGVHLSYAAFTTSANVGVYNLSGYNIQEVVGLELNDVWGQINTLFSPIHIMFQELGQGPSNGPVLRAYTPNVGYGPATGLEITEFQIAMQYLELVKQQFGIEYTTDWIPGREELRIYPTPSEVVTGLIAYYKKEEERYILDNPLYIDLAIARVKRLWGFMLNKTVISIPGGGTVSGSEILAEGKEDEVAAMEKIRGESEPIDMFIG